MMMRVSISNFGAQLRTSRLALGLSQEKLAHECGLDRTSISSVERGKRNVSLLNIHKLAAALGIQAAELLITKGGSK
jgi:transcriptional regulator with XRE-family HTH domain